MKKIFNESRNAGNDQGIYDAFPCRIYVGKKWQYVVPLAMDGITELCPISRRSETAAFGYGGYVLSRHGWKWEPYPAFRRLRSLAESETRKGETK